jgi:hypothetical protein
LPALLRAEKLVKKAHKAKVLGQPAKRRLTQTALAKELFELASFAQANNWSAEELLTAEIKKRERDFRRQERYLPSR